MSGDIIEKKSDTYVGRNFQVSASGGSNISSKIPDVLARMRNILVKMFERNNLLPKIIVMVPENNIINGLKVAQSEGQTIHFGQAIEWIVDQHTDIIDEFRGWLPHKAKKNKKNWPFVLWICPSLHDNYNELDLQKRKKFTKCLEKVAHGDRNISSLRLLKQNWDQQDDSLITRDHRFTTHGWNTFWSAVDQTIQYFDEKMIPNMMEKRDLYTYFPNRNWVPKDKQAASTSTYHDRGHDKDRRTYESTHWSKFDKQPVKKHFGRDYQKMREDKSDLRRKLPTPPNLKKRH